MSTTPTDKEKLRAIIRHLEDTPWPLSKMNSEIGTIAIAVLRATAKEMIVIAKNALKEKLR